MAFELAQISRVTAKRYADEVGPWRVYLSVLHRKEPSSGLSGGNGTR